MRIPSVKTIREGLRVSQEQAEEIREILEGFRDRFPGGFNSSGSFVRPSRAFDRISEILGYHGFESIPRGRNDRSPTIYYVNGGDTYSPTILYVNGHFRVRCWGDIVERGDYD